MRTILAAGMAMAAMAGPGCVMLVAEVGRYVPDARLEKEVRVVEVTGTTLLLSDGRRVTPAGVDEAALTPAQRAEFEANLRKALMFQMVLVTDQKGDRAAVQEFVRDPRVPWEWPVFVLIPIYVDCPTVWVQAMTPLVRQGLVRASPGQLADPKLAKELTDAEEEARKDHVGIWGQPGAASRPGP